MTIAPSANAPNEINIHPSTLNAGGAALSAVESLPGRLPVIRAAILLPAFALSVCALSWYVVPLVVNTDCIAFELAASA